MSQTKVVAGLGVLLVAAGLIFILTQGLHPTHKLEVDQGSEVAAGGPAADFTLIDLEGKPIKLSALRGKVVFLNVWATWCGPCREEMPSMETLYEKLKNRNDFVMLAVSEDRGDRDAVSNFVAKRGLSFPILLDPQNTVGEAYGVTGVPETFIIDRKGQIVAHHMGSFDWSRDDVQQALIELLDGKES